MFGFQNKHGTIVVDGKEVGITLQCIHCGMHWEVVKGSGKKRGWCPKCQGPCCGQEKCMVCVPLEAKLEFCEAEARDHTAVLQKLIGKYPDIPFLPL